jgi:hypothetical protein
MTAGQQSAITHRSQQRKILLIDLTMLQLRGLRQKA